MKITFRFIPGRGPNLRDKLSTLIENDDFYNYLAEMSETEIAMELKPAVKLSEKQQMYAYYYGPLLSVAINAFSDLGWESMDKEKADHLLKEQCATGIMIKNGKESTYLEDKSGMTKKRLHKYITDCILFLEQDLGIQNIPDAETFKYKESTGYNFKSISKKKFN